MFTGIIENIGIVTALDKAGSNITFSIQSPISSELKVDQSVAHNGVCLTIIGVEGNTHQVTAIDETLQKSNLKFFKIGDEVNLERCLKLNDRLDGHMVQGHVDQTAKCTERRTEGGSWIFTFEYSSENKNITVEKGSICVNGVSLTVINSQKNSFSVAIIPYTFEHTVFHQIFIGDEVNLEFDILGKYITRWMELRA
ncbi:MAG: riboflavin synthase [Bacteroidetes bacterium]|nr:riboflavin synthase [Bacteroidota bacterium]